jgi:hypothetical protein
VSAVPRRSILGAALASVLTGCASRGRHTDEIGFGDPPDTGTSGIGPAALDRWRDFPVTRKPRPILLLDAALRETGYHSGDAKLAVATGRYELAAALPSTRPATITVRLPDGRFPLPTISAAQAYEGVRGSGSPKNAPDADVAPLRITKVELKTAPFFTDRGRLTLPAWLFHAPDSFEPLAWPALRPDAFWRLGELPPPTLPGDGRLAADGVSLTVTMEAPDPAACPGEPVYRHVPVVMESRTAVAVGVRREVVRIEPGQRRGDCASTLMLRTQPYKIRLAAPLGNRVLVNGSGDPVPVTGTYSGR